MTGDVAGRLRRTFASACRYVRAMLRELPFQLRHARALQCRVRSTRKVAKSTFGQSIFSTNSAGSCLKSETSEPCADDVIRLRAKSASCRPLAMPPARRPRSSARVHCPEGWGQRFGLSECWQLLLSWCIRLFTGRVAGTPPGWWPRVSVTIRRGSGSSLRFSSAFRAPKQHRLSLESAISKQADRP